jgi:HlyD family secretion protein
VRRSHVAIIAVVGLAATGGLLYWLLSGAGQEAGNVLRLSGHIEATETDLAFKVPGKIAAINFYEGDLLKPGQVVAELEAQDLRDDVTLAEANAAAAGANLAKLLAGSRPQEIREAKAAVDEAKADMDNKKLDFERNQKLFEEGVVSVARRDNARTAYRVAEEAYRRALESFRLVKEGPRREDIEAARAELARARANLELARTRLGYARLVAPTAGVVLVREAEPGEVAQVGSPVLTTGDLARAYLEAYIPETDLARVRYKQRAVVTTDTYPGKEYPGWVSFVASQAEFTPKTVETRKERVTLVYRVKIRVENPGYELKPGMPADGVIFLEGEQH